MTDVARGCAQLEKLDGFIATRRDNAATLRVQLADTPFVALPDELIGGSCSWFGFPIRVLPGSPLNRNGLVAILDAHKVGTRLVFAGNIVHQPAYRDVRYRVAAALDNADVIMNEVLWIGTYPGLGIRATRIRRRRHQHCAAAGRTPSVAPVNVATAMHAEIRLTVPKESVVRLALGSGLCQNWT